MRHSKGNRRLLLFLLLFLMLLPALTEEVHFLERSDEVYHLLGHCMPWLARW